MTTERMWRHSVVASTHAPRRRKGRRRRRRGAAMTMMMRMDCRALLGMNSC